MSRKGSPMKVFAFINCNDGQDNFSLWLIDGNRTYDEFLAGRRVTLTATVEDFDYFNWRLAPGYRSRILLRLALQLLS